MGKKGKNKPKEGAVGAGAKAGDEEPPVATSSALPAKGKKRAKDEIDDIFSIVKKPKPEEAKEPGKNGKGDSEAKPSGQKPTKIKGSVDDIFGVETDKQRKRTEEGYAIYHEDELKMNKGGDTDLCPFDCQCCF